MFSQSWTLTFAQSQTRQAMNAGRAVGAGRRLRSLLEAPGQILRTPCCHDALSARLIQQAGFPCAFVSGFGVAAGRGVPDTGLLSFGEVKSTVETILDATCANNELQERQRDTVFPIIVDADTGYGNEVNVRRTIRQYAQIGCAGIMIEDQVAPKRCGHAQKGKSVVPMEEACNRIRAACEARHELGLDIVIIARTDAREQHGLEHALQRAQAFHALGADVTFVEAPKSVEELERIAQTPQCGYRMVNLLLHGKTPNLPSQKLLEMGFHLAAYPFDLLVASIQGMQDALQRLGEDDKARDYTKDQVDELWKVVGFPKYYRMEDRYRM